MPKICSLDYETRSTVDLKESGAYVYARHPSTSVLCACYSIDGGPILNWPALYVEMPADLAAAFADPACEMHAWNSQFERLITKHVLGLHVALDRWRCTAAWARSRGLPGGLEDALQALGKRDSLAVKRTGSKVMLKWAVPLNLPGDKGYPLWADDLDEYAALVRYCDGDVESEMSAQKALRAVPMTAAEWEDFFVNERINDRGLPIDRDLALAAADYGEDEKEELNDRLYRESGGFLSTTSQHHRVKAFLREFLHPWVYSHYFVNEQGKESTDKRAREEFLLTYATVLDEDGAPDLSADDREVAEYHITIAAEVLDILNDAGKASVGKFAKMAAFSAGTRRAQGAYLYAGAGQTKRYSSRGIQMHNLPRATPEADRLDDVIEAVHTGDLRVLVHDGDVQVMHVLASLLRPTIKADCGRVLVWGDWQQVEARAMPWLAGAEAKLDLYRQGIDVYRVNAENIFGVPAADATDAQRQIGKVAELSLQFGGAVGALRAMARGYGIAISVAEAAHIVKAWRTANRWAPEFSYGLMRAFSTCAMRTTGEVHRCGRIAYQPMTRFGLAGNRLTIECDLPDGTRLFYPGLRGGDVWQDGIRTEDGVEHPVYKTISMPKRLEVALPFNPATATTHYRPKGRVELTYDKMLAGGIAPARIWHGLLAENVTQAVCAALLRDCLKRTEAALAKAKLRASVIGHTHDEIILEAEDYDAAKAAKVLHREMVRVPKWLPGFPLAADIKTAERYGK